MARNKILFGIIGLVLGFGCAWIVLRTASRNEDLNTVDTTGVKKQLSFIDVVLYLESKDEEAKQNTISYSEMFFDIQRTPYFLYICNHLDEVDLMLSFAETRKMPIMWEIVWRAAFLTGTREQIAAVFNSDLLSIHSPSSLAYIANDLAYDSDLTEWLLLESGASDDALLAFIDGLSSESPDSWRWKSTDYSRELAAIMRSTKKSLVIRAFAAYALARWSGDTPLGKEAQEMLAFLASKDYSDFRAKSLLNRLETLGTEGWKDPGTQPAR